MSHLEKRFLIGFIRAQPPKKSIEANSRVTLGEIFRSLQIVASEAALWERKPEIAISICWVHFLQNCSGIEHS